MNSAAVVLNLDSNGLGVVRSLGREGISVYGIDYHNDAVGFSSKFCKQQYLFAHPVSDPDKCLQQFIDLGKRFTEKPVLIPTADYYVVFISKYRDELDSYYRFNIPGQRVLESIVDKNKQYAWAKELGVPIPQTYCAGMIDSPDALSNELRFPVFVKGVDSSAWFAAFRTKGFIAKDIDELRTYFLRAAGHKMQIVMQEIIPGANKNHYKVCAYYTKDKKLLAMFTTQKTRQYPADFGVGSYMTSKNIPEIMESGKRFFEGIGYTGVGSIEFKFDERDNQFKLIELNPRIWMQNVQAARAGINFALINYLDCLDRTVEPQLLFQENICWLDAIQDFQSFLMNRKRSDITLFRWLHSVVRASCYAYFAMDDLKPGWINSGCWTKYLKLPAKLFSHRV